MLRIDHIKLPPGTPEGALRRQAANILHVPEGQIKSLRIVRRSVDAREEVSLVYSIHVAVENEGKVLRRVRGGRVTQVVRQRYHPPGPVPAPELAPVVVGAGPAGLFCALILAQAGAKPILLERGQPVEQRQQDVEAFWRTGILNPASNVQFGEGGAGAFSDGKLNTGTRDLCHRWILGKLVEFGVPDSILIDAHPHAGTDMLHAALKAMRQELLRLGAEIRFGHQLVDLTVRDGSLSALTVSGPAGEYVLHARQAVLALGHSARDTVEMLHSRGVPMEAKPFAVGVRIEHRQRDMDAAQYGKYAGHPCLPVSSYKLSCHLEGGRSVFSFCVCPGGQVVAAASEEGRTVTNGMSYYARDGENINGGLLVNVTPADFPDGVLGGIAFQRQLEAAAFSLGGGGFRAPAQRVEDFLARRPSAGPGTVVPTYRPGVTWTDLHRCLPDFLCTALEQALPILGRRVRGFDGPDAVLTAVESRSSSPVRILRGEDRQSPAVRGLYPCGEGAGFAGGILSAAADGIHTAEAMLTHMAAPAHPL